MNKSGPTIHLLDGGVASQLVSQGFSMIDSDPLWSARLLHTHPEAVKAGHIAFRQAGAEIIETNTYQVSCEGFYKYLQVDEATTLSLVKDSVLQLARPSLHASNSSYGLVCGAIGPYGACQHDGSEYHGNYVDEITAEHLTEWHRPRLQALVEAGVDILAFETIPAAKEADCLINLLNEFPDQRAWLSFSCKDGLRTNHGELLYAAVQRAVNEPQITHVGVNCTSPEFVESLLNSLQAVRHLKPFVVYPNSGESWTSGRGWNGDRKLTDIDTFVNMCIEKGATIIGGCCRVTAEQIAAMRRAINKHLQTV